MAVTHTTAIRQMAEVRILMVLDVGGCSKESKRKEEREKCSKKERKRIDLHPYPCSYSTHNDNANG